MNNKIKYLFSSLFLFLSNAFIFAEDIDMGGGWTSGGNGSESQGEGAQGVQNPIDMYDGVLLLIAILLIVGYYLYKRNRRIVDN